MSLITKHILKRNNVADVALIRVVVIVFQLLFLKIYTRNTSFYELGIFYFLLTTSYLINAFLLVPLDYFQQSQLYILKKSSQSLKSFLPINKIIIKTAFYGTLLALMVCYFIKPQFLFTLVLIVFYALSTYLVNLLRNIINNLELKRQAVNFLAFEYILKIIYYYTYTYFFKSSSHIILLSLLSASALSLFLMILYIKRLPEYKIGIVKKYNIGEIVSAAYPISISAVLNWIQLQSYTIFLVPFGLTEIVGIYATVANIGSGGMNAYSTIYTQLFVPKIYKSNGKYILTYIFYAILSLLFVIIVTSYFSAFIISLLTKPGFVKYSPIIIYGVLTEGGNFIIAALIIYLTIHNLTKVSISVSIFGVLVFFSVFITLYLIKKLNIFTIGLPMVCTQIAVCISLFLIVLKSEKQSHVR